MRNEGRQIGNPKQGRFRNWIRALGPGLVTGAADDDPSGVATYSIAGAQLGGSLLWMSLLTWPLMAAVQMMCARIGMVTGQGLSGALHKKFPKPILIVASVALLAANTINVGADLAGMADAAGMLTGISSHWFVVLFGAGIAIASIRCRYQQIAAVLKWLCLILFAYVITAFMVVSDWAPLLKMAISPSLPKNHEEWALVVAILGTTISPYLFYWQASQEVEEEKACGRRMLIQRKNATDKELIDRKLDVATGTFFSNLVMFFIIVATAMTLHKNGITNIESSKQAAEALRPLAGRFAALLYTTGIIGVGLLAIPVLSGSAAYALAETFNWRQGLDEKLKGAPQFYTVIIISTGLGVLLDYAHVNPVKALFATAVINGVLAPVLLVGILLVASDRKIMCGQPSSKYSLAVVSITTILMTGAAVAMFVF